MSRLQSPIMQPLPIMQSLDLANSSHPSPDSCSSRKHDSVSSKESRLVKWLVDIDDSSYSHTTRATSCPPRLQDQGSISVVTDQQPLLEFLQSMSTATRMGPSSPTYRAVLQANGVQIDNGGKKIPAELRDFLDGVILADRSLTALSSETIDNVRNTVLSIESKAEDSVKDLASTPLLPITHHGADKGGDLLWNIDCLPNKEEYPHSITAPKPDIYLGYPDNTWTFREQAVIDHPDVLRVTRPTKRTAFPFLVFELKAESTGGTLWHAENQAAGSGACSVNILRWIFNRAREYHPEVLITVLDTMAFSICATHRTLLFHVHHYSSTEETNYMSLFKTVDTSHGIQASNHIVQNIIDHCMERRLSRIRNVLALLYPVTSQWRLEDSTKGSRRASGEDLGESPQKKKKTFY